MTSTHKTYQTDVIIIGAGAAGLFCAIEAGKRRRQVLVLDHANKVGKKILMSGGGRCNFTNTDVSYEKYLSHNPHFCKSALSCYTAWDFISLVRQYKIPFHEKTLGQLFCDNKSQDIVDMLLQEIDKVDVDILLQQTVLNINKIADFDFEITTETKKYRCQSLVIATGGLSIPTMGASSFGYKVAEQFDLHVWPTRAGLVPLTLHDHDKEKYAVLSGVSHEVVVRSEKKSFHENFLITHRGLSGPAILQISSYWQPGELIAINYFPNIDLSHEFLQMQKQAPNIFIRKYLAEKMSKNLLQLLMPKELLEKTFQDCSRVELLALAEYFQDWKIKPNGTEGYRTAEVTLGGVDVDALSSKTMAVKNHPGLYFIGEVLDVTGWLGGYNFQWAWSSGWAAGQVV